jgi:signal transduction histidine kinase
MFNISVTDKGIGITEDDIQRLFTPYFKTKEENSLKLNPMGHGLGLYISNSIAE